MKISSTVVSSLMSLLVSLSNTNNNVVYAAPPFDVTGNLESGGSTPGAPPPVPGSQSLAERFIDRSCGSFSRSRNLGGASTVGYGVSSYDADYVSGYDRSSSSGKKGGKKGGGHSNKKSGSCGCWDVVVRIRDSDVVFESGSCRYIFSGRAPPGPFTPGMVPDEAIGYECSADVYNPCGDWVIGTYTDYAMRIEDSSVFLGSGSYNFHSGMTSVYTRYTIDLSSREPPQFNGLVGGTGIAAFLVTGQEVQLGYIPDDTNNPRGIFGQGGFVSILLYGCAGGFDLCALEDDPSLIADLIIPMECPGYPCMRM